MLFNRLVIVLDLLDPNFVILDTIQLVERALARYRFWNSGACRVLQER